MKLKEELRQVEVPQTLSLRNDPVVDSEENTVANSEDTLSPETLSHRLHQGWQQLQEYSETLLNNNNNLPCNDNNNSNVVTDTVAPYLVDGNFRPMSSDESGSSSEDESSVSYSDTSPLLEVSSYDSDVSLYSDMSEDGSLLENSENNNNDDDGDDGNLLEASRMSLSSPSLDESSDCSSISSSKGSPGNKVILPDVLPVGRVSNHEEEDDDDDLMSDASLSDVEIKGHDAESVNEFHVQKECCVVQVTSEPDIQVDIRMNSAKAPTKDNSLGNKNSYPNGMADGMKRSLQKRNLYTWSVDEKYDVYNTANKTSVRHWDRCEPDSSDKISVVDGLKNLAVKDTVKTKAATHHLPDLHSEEKQENVRKIQTKGVQANIQKRRKNSVSPLPETVSLFGKETQQYSTAHVGLPTKEECHIHSSKTYPQKSPNHQKRSSASPLLCRKENRDNNSNQCSSNKSSASQTSVSNNPSATNRTVVKKTSKDKAASSPELFEVYTIEAEASHINWVDLRKSDPESEWIRKRRNDREEIRRKLAMDSDTEEFLPEKVNQNSENKPSMRARDNSNLQICFVNEAVTDEDSPKSCDTKVNDSVKACDLLPVPQNVPSQAASSNTPAVKNSSRTPNNNSAQSSVVKRQRPTFFFNRPRSMILQKTDQKAGVEDLVSRHIRLQAEAREALAQAKEMARMQMEIEKQQKKKSPIAEIVGLPFPDGKTYLNHSTLKDMNVAQLQVIVNDLHSQIESLNEDLVKFLLERDDLHMEQDSMLVDIEDLTRYLGLKGSNCVSHPTHSQTSIKTYNASSDKVLKSEPVVKRSHSVQLRKTKNLM